MEIPTTFNSLLVLTNSVSRGRHTRNAGPSEGGMDKKAISAQGGKLQSYYDILVR